MMNRFCHTKLLLANQSLLKHITTSSPAQTPDVEIPVYCKYRQAYLAVNPTWVNEFGKDLNVTDVHLYVKALINDHCESDGW